MGKMISAVVKNADVFVGLEDSKRSWKLCVRSGGIVVQELSMPADFQNLLSHLKNNYPGCRITVLYEAGFRGFGLHDKLVAEGIGCVVTPAHRVTQEKGRKVKCDKIDARRLAVVLENGDFSACHVPDKELREDRQVSRCLIQLQNDITRTKNRIRKFFDFHGYDETLPEGAWYDRDYQSLAELSLPEPLQLCLNLHLEHLKHLSAAKISLRKQLRALARKPRYNQLFKLFCTAPGVGWYTAIRLVLEWGEDLSRFTNAKQFASFTGLTASEYSTGESVQRGSITKDGARHVRAWLIECAWTAYKHDKELLHKFDAVSRSSGSKKKAIVAVARKLAVRLRAVALSGQPYKVAA
jgi:transposase